MDETVVSKTTDKGLKFLYHCPEIMELLETEDDEHKLYGWIRLLPATFTQHL
ncbi:MAG: hypothetical protein ABSF24_09905 [Candidatus Bathyarchaeia archaeon]